MFTEIGKKIKGLAIAIFIIEAVLYFILWIVTVAIYAEISVGIILLSFGIMLLAILFSWISTWLLYGFGELVDKVSSIESSLRAKKSGCETQNKNLWANKVTQEDYERMIDEF